MRPHGVRGYAIDAGLSSPVTALHCGVHQRASPGLERRLKGVDAVMGLTAYVGADREAVRCDDWRRANISVGDPGSPTANGWWR